MAEALGVVASVLTLSQALSVTGKALARFKSCYNAKPEIARLREEAERLGRFLENIEDFARNIPSGRIRNELAVVVALAGSNIDAINETLSLHAFGMKRLSEASKERATILRHKSLLAKHEDQLRVLTEQISSYLCLAIAQGDRHLADLCDALIKSQESRFVEVLAQLERISKRLPEAKENNQMQDQHQDQFQPIVNEFRAQSGLENRENFVAGKWKHNTRNQSECRTGCYCSCHIRQYLTLPWPLNPILGMLSLYRCYGKSGVSCTCTRYSSLAIKYRPPPYLWYLCRRYISINLHRGNLAGPEFLLRVPRVLPWAHLYWHYSICGDVKAIQRMFADREASPHDVDPAGRNALLHAAKHESTELAIFLLEQGADESQPDELGRAPSERILKRSLGGLYNDHGVIMRLILKGDNFDEFGFTTLHKIVFGFLTKDLWTVLEANPDTINSTDYLGRTPLFWAVLCDNVKHVSLLLAYGANPNARDVRGNTPLDFVRSPVVCQMLFSHGAKMNINPQNYYRSSLHEHILEKGCPDVIDAFASAGLNIDIKDSDDETPLLNAIHAGQTDVVKRLINLGANINSVNKSSRDSALHFAAQYNRTECLKLLLAHGADCGALAWNGRSFAHCAARSGSAELIRMIVDAKLSTLDLALTDSEGKRPGQWMESRVVRTDCEIGVHEAWEELNHQFVASDRDRQGEGFEESFKIPGTFPVDDITTEM